MEGSAIDHMVLATVLPLSYQFEDWFRSLNADIPVVRSDDQEPYKNFISGLVVSVLEGSPALEKFGLTFVQTCPQSEVRVNSFLGFRLKCCLDCSQCASDIIETSSSKSCSCIGIPKGNVWAECCCC